LGGVWFFVGCASEAVQPFNPDTKRSLLLGKIKKARPRRGGVPTIKGGGEASVACTLGAISDVRRGTKRKKKSSFLYGKKPGEKGMAEGRGGKNRRRLILFQSEIPG